jgi:hypothetical protein
MTGFDLDEAYDVPEFQTEDAANKQWKGDATAV